MIPSPPSLPAPAWLAGFGAGEGKDRSPVSLPLRRPACEALPCCAHHLLAPLVTPAHPLTLAPAGMSPGSTGLLSPPVPAFPCWTWSTSSRSRAPHSAPQHQHCGTQNQRGLYLHPGAQSQHFHLSHAHTWLWHLELAQTPYIHFPSSKRGSSPIFWSPCLCPAMPLWCRQATSSSI